MAAPPRTNSPPTINRLPYPTSFNYYSTCYTKPRTSYFSFPFYSCSIKQESKKLSEPVIIAEKEEALLFRSNDARKTILPIPPRGFRLPFGKGRHLSNKLSSIILLNVVTVVYASNIPIVKQVETIVDPGAFTVVRFSLAAITFLPFVLESRDDVEIRRAGIELGIWVSLGYIMQALGLLTSDAGRAAFLTMFTVLVVPFLDGLLGSIIPARTWFGALMSIVGVAMLESSGSPPCVGDLLNFLSALFFGVHMLRTEHISRRTNKEKFFALLGYEVCVVAFLSATWYVAGGWIFGLHDLHVSNWTWTAFWDSFVKFPWVPALYTGIFSTGLCLWAEMAAMRDVSATEAAIIYGLEPLWGAGFAWFLLGERWGLSGWIGAALILVGSLTVQIHGAISTASSVEDNTSGLRGGDMLISEKKDVFTKALVVVSSREDSSKLLKK